MDVTCHVIRVNPCVTTSVEYFGAFSAMVRGLNDRVRIVCLRGALLRAFARGLLRGLNLYDVRAFTRFLRSPGVPGRVNAGDAVPGSGLFCHVRVDMGRFRRFLIQLGVFLCRILRRVQGGVRLQLGGDRMSVFLTLGVNVRHSPAFL